MSAWRIPCGKRSSLIARVYLGLVLGSTLCLPRPAWAQTLPPSLPRLTEEELLPTRSDFEIPQTLLGDWGGMRSWLNQYGVSFTLNQTSDYIGNTRGGIKQGFVYDGLLDLEIDVDLNKAIGWKGGKVHLTGYGIQGQDLSTQYVGNLMTVSNIESEPSIAKLGEAWIEQRLFDDRLSLRGGLLEADRYYMISPTANVFVNSTFGFPDAWEANMPGSGPGYPNATPGALARFAINNDWEVTASVMNGSPIGPSTKSMSYGLNFPTDDGVLSWLEVNYSPEFKLGDHTMPGYFKLGGWYNSAAIDNVTLSDSGRNFINPVNTSYRGQYSVYGLVDQAVFRENSADTQGLNVFTRVTFNPQTDRNLVTWYFDAGIAYLGLFDGRPNDIIGLGFGWAKFTPYLNNQVSAQNAGSSTPMPLPKPESLIELTYQAPLSPWLTMQPFLQIIANPGGSASMPNNPNQAIPHATVVGLRANVAF
ncbi:MAG: carbohydrate porin [Rhodocyclaceae bacterium]|jgi:porin|nr:carbohydrate porin [Rhodocyclaceae bacterium]